MVSQRTVSQVREVAKRIAEAAMLAMVWSMLSVQALGQWLIGRSLLVPRRQRAQGTLEIIIAMAVLGVLALSVWKLIGPAVLIKAGAVAQDLQTSGSGTNGTGG